MNRSLVLVRAGTKSLHQCWLQPGNPRNWDLHLVPYQPVPPQIGFDCVVSDVIAGPKWSGIREYLHRWDGWRDYDYLWFPDDDIYATQDTISTMFDVARTVGFDLFAPALHDASYFAHFTTMRNRSFHGRWTGFVEIMMPGFSASALKELLPTLDLTETGWGWGLDSLWPKLLDYRNVAIIDGVPVLHTRPVGQMRDAELARRVHEESDRILRRDQCRQVHTTFAAFGPDLARLAIDPERFFAELVKGWQHLIEEDPRILTWLVDYQKELFRWPDYPVAGTP